MSEKLKQQLEQTQRKKTFDVQIETKVQWLEKRIECKSDATKNEWDVETEKDQPPKDSAQ